MSPSATTEEPASKSAADATPAEGVAKTDAAAATAAAAAAGAKPSPVKLTPAKRPKLASVMTNEAALLGLGNIVCSCIAKCEVDLKKELYGNVIVTGATRPARCCGGGGAGG